MGQVSGYTPAAALTGPEFGHGEQSGGDVKITETQRRTFALREQISALDVNTVIVSTDAFKTFYHTDAATPSWGIDDTGFAVGDWFKTVLGSTAGAASIGMSGGGTLSWGTFAGGRTLGAGAVARFVKMAAGEWRLDGSEIS